MRDDCGQCPACADKPRFGGRGSKKKVKNRLKYLQINNCKIKINNVQAVCSADKPRFGGRGTKKKVYLGKFENFIKMLNCLKIH